MQRTLLLAAVSAVLSAAGVAAAPRQPCPRVSSVVSTSVTSPSSSVTPSTIAPSDPVSSTIIPAPTSVSADPVISSTSVSSSTSALPSPTNIVLNSGFEDETNINWDLHLPDGMTGTFGRVPFVHSGTRGVVIIAKAAVSGYISQRITVQPHTSYTFSAWVATSSLNTGCDVTYYIGTPDGTGQTQVLATVPSAKLGAYIQSTATYTSGDDTDVSINAMVTCPQPPGTRGFYFDDITLTT